MRAVLVPAVPVAVEDGAEPPAYAFTGGGLKAGVLPGGRRAVITRLRRWLRYRQALDRAVDARLDAGYRISAPAYEQMKAKAREAAGLRQGIEWVSLRCAFNPVPHACGKPWCACDCHR